MSQRLLHQFPISHYCEKIRWVLDYKGLPYQVRNQLPPLHLLVNRRLVGRGSVPVLVDGSHAIGKSSDIALYLDDQYPAQRLIPADPQRRVEVLALEAYFDEHPGPAVRRWWYSFATSDLPLFKRTFFFGYSGLTRTVGELLAGPVAKRIAAMYQVSGDGREEASRVIDEAVSRLEQLIDGGARRYLVGDSFTLADLTAASLLGPLVAPPQLAWTHQIDVPEVLARREALRARPAGRWLLSRYAEDRAPARLPRSTNQERVSGPA